MINKDMIQNEINDMHNDMNNDMNNNMKNDMNNDIADFPIVVLISGNGSNLQAIINAIEAGECPAKIQAVISNEAEAYGLTRAKQANIHTHVISHRNFSDRSAFESALIQCIDVYKAKLIVLAGFMRILSSHFVRHYPNKIINIHPALLPKYKGLNTHERVFAAKEAEHGVSIHFVTESLDDGPLLAQSKIKVLEIDTPETLQTRVQTLEHQLYPKVIADIARGKYHENFV